MTINVWGILNISSLNGICTSQRLCPPILNNDEFAMTAMLCDGPLSMSLPIAIVIITQRHGGEMSFLTVSMLIVMLDIVLSIAHFKSQNGS